MSGPRQPVAAARSDPDARLRLRFDMLDDKHWPLHGIQNRDLKKVLSRLSHIEGMTLAQARANGTLGEYDMADCPNKQATKILADRHQGRDTLTKLVIQPSGPLRMFAIREGHELHLLWWDPKHEVWPEGKIRR